MLATWYWVVLTVALCFGVSIVVGAPYLPVLGRDVEALLDLAGLERGQTVVDLGAGDGKLLRAVARRGGYGIGYEINPILWLISLVLCWPYRKRIKLHLANYWQVPLPPCDIVYVFLYERFMSRLDHKLTTEARGPLKLVSYIYKIPGKTPVRELHNAQVYQYDT